MGHEALEHTLAWIDPEQAGLLQRVCASCGGNVTDLGTTASESGIHLEAGLEHAQIHNDWRALLNSRERATVFMGSARAGSAHGAIPSEEFAGMIRAAGHRCVSLVPIPMRVSEWNSLSDHEEVEPIRLVPTLANHPAFHEAIELTSTLGGARTVAVSMRCGRIDGGLGARLLDAMQSVLLLLGVPDLIDASVVTPSTSGALRMSPGETLFALEGDLTANLRYGSGSQAASIVLSDRAGRWFRGCTIVCDEGALRLDEMGIEQFRADGSVVDAPRSDLDRRDPSGESEIIEGVRRWLDPHAPRAPKFDQATALAMCEAALLSARTGHAESPDLVFRMAGAAQA